MDVLDSTTRPRPKPLLPQRLQYNLSVAWPVKLYEEHALPAAKLQLARLGPDAARFPRLRHGENQRCFFSIVRYTVFLGATL